MALGLIAVRVSDSILKSCMCPIQAYRRITLIDSYLDSYFPEFAAYRDVARPARLAAESRDDVDRARRYDGNRGTTKGRC